MPKKQITAKWEKEQRAVRATQVAFDVGEKAQRAIRREALEKNLAPSDCIRTILGLKTTHKPKRLRLSVSLTEADFEQLAERFELSPSDRLAIKHKAAELLIEHTNKLSNEYGLDD